jgi:uncharacterized SAM-binding protein YcdF (DUF218 family)
VFFLLSKILVPLETPSDLLLLLLIVGIGLAWSSHFRRTGLIIVTAVVAIFSVIALFPVSSWIGAPLEDRFPRPSTLPQHVDGIVVLGGAVKPGITEKRGLPSLNSRAERMTEFVRLAKLYPEARLVFSGGSGLLESQRPKMTEADTARLFFQQQGLDIHRITFENRSRNTYENVVFTKALVKPLPEQVWILVSSAQDMPRSVGIFRKQEWPVFPVPVAYKTGDQSDHLSDDLSAIDDNVHEWLGLVVYYLTGKTDALFPAPG